MRATGPGTVFLLGAGASKNAGLPLASEMTGMVLEHFNTEGSIPRYGPTLNFVVSAMIAHAGRSGRRPDQLPDIESVVSAIDLLSQRTDLELTPFVQSWDPGVTSVNSSTPYYFMSNIGRSFRNAVDAKHASAAEHEMRSIFNALFREKVGREASEATYRDLNEELMRWLVPNLAVSGDSGHLDYLTPLLALGKRLGGVTIATLNYDLAVETAAARQGIPLSTGVDDWETVGAVSFPPEGLHLLKLHGSIAWSITHPSQPKEYVVPPERFRPRPPQVDSGELPAVIYGRRGKLRGDGPFLDIRSEFSRRLQSASCLVSVGYSFADDHVNALIRRWLTSGADRWVLSLDPWPPKPGQTDEQTFAGELWGSLPTRYSGRKVGARPVFYPWETTAEAGLPTAVLPPEQLREMFRGWEASLAGADSWSVPGIHQHLPLS